MFGSCFVVQYLVSFLVFSSSHLGKDRAGYFSLVAF